MGRWPSFSRSPLDSGSRRPAAPSRPLPWHQPPFPVPVTGTWRPSRGPRCCLGVTAVPSAGGAGSSVWEGELVGASGRGSFRGRHRTSGLPPRVSATAGPAARTPAGAPHPPRPRRQPLVSAWPRPGPRRRSRGRARGRGAGPPPPEADRGRTFTSSARSSYLRYASVEHPVPAPPRGCAALLQGRGGARSVRPGGACGRRRLRPCPGVGLLSGCDGPAGGDPVPVPVRAVGGPRPGSVPGGVAARAALLAGPAAPAPPDTRVTAARRPPDRRGRGSCCQRRRRDGPWLFQGRVSVAGGTPRGARGGAARSLRGSSRPAPPAPQRRVCTLGVGA